MSAPGLRTRVLVLAAVLAVAFGGVTARLAWLQIVRHAELTALAERQYTRTVVLHAPRGPIVDRHGTALAASMPAESLFVQPRYVDDPVRAAAERSRVAALGMDETTPVERAPQRP